MSTPGNTDVLSGDQHIADLIAHLERSPQWGHMLVVVTYDENGGIWDHVLHPERRSMGNLRRVFRRSSSRLSRVAAWSIIPPYGDHRTSVPAWLITKAIFLALGIAAGYRSA